MKNILFISPTGTLDNGAELSIIQLMALLQEKGIVLSMSFKTALHSLEVIMKRRCQVEGSLYIASHLQSGGGQKHLVVSLMIWKQQP